MGKSTINGHFHSYVSLPEGKPMVFRLFILLHPRLRKLLAPAVENMPGLQIHIARDQQNQNQLILIFDDTLWL